jgi:thiamine-phosphate pyrophosphorylase
MKRRQTLPRQWLVADRRLDGQMWDAVRALPRGSGVLILYRDLPGNSRAKIIAKLRRLAATRDLLLVDEAAGQGARVHDMKEIRQAGIAGIPILFLSPMFPTRSHPGRKPLKRMRAAALLRLAKSPVFALGGMDERRFRRIQRLGFSGWAGIDAWIRI